MKKGVEKEIKRIERWIAKETDGKATIIDFLYEAAEIKEDVLEEPTVDNINRGLWDEADTFLTIWKENNQDTKGDENNDYINKTRKEEDQGAMRDWKVSRTEDV